MFRFKKSRSRDKGMTLPEVLISVALTGMVCAALAMSITVVLRQTDNTGGRVNNARSEQSVSLWMPADLASADSVDTLPGALPCTLPCPPGANIGGSNALMLTWTSQVFDTATGLPVVTTTKVSYRYMQIGAEWVMVRVECTTVGAAATTCNSQTVLHGLDAPPGLFEPGISTPTWVIEVSQALDPASIDPSDTTPVDPTLKNKNGQRVVVTINGGGDAGGAGGGTNQISLSAGGTERKQNLDPIDNSGVPPFLAARSRCGGNFALVVDVSGSIGAANMGASLSGTPNWSTVRGSLYKFIEAFQGTPVKLELVKFSDAASVLGAAAGGQMYYDMLDPAQVSTLKSLVGYPNTSGGLQSGGKTNWEDGFYKVFKKTDGTVQPILPKMLIFFTDGVPTWSRVQSNSAPMHAADVPLPGQSDTYYQTAWNRANRLLRPFDADVQSLIGMFVGSSTADSPWQDSLGYHLDNWQKGYHTDYFVGNGVIYQRGSTGGTFQRSDKVVWERGYHPLRYERNNNVVFERSGTGMKFEKFSSGSWSTSGFTLTQWFTGNTTTDSSDGWRVSTTGTLGSWTNASPSMTQTTHDRANTTDNDQTDGFRARLSGSLSGTWQTVTQAQYDSSNSTTDSTDGWRIVPDYTAPFTMWEASSQATYNIVTNNTVAGETRWMANPSDLRDAELDEHHHQRRLHVEQHDARHRWHRRLPPQRRHLYRPVHHLGEHHSGAVRDEQHGCCQHRWVADDSTGGEHHMVDAVVHVVQQEQPDRRRHGRLQVDRRLQLAVRHLGEHHGGVVQRQQHVVGHDGRLAGNKGLRRAVHVVRGICGSQQARQGHPRQDHSARR